MKCQSGEPVSWLRLELYGLGELPEVEARQVAEHLAACSACNACFERIGAPAPALALPLPAAASTPRAQTARAHWRTRAVWAAGSLVSAALGAWLLVVSNLPKFPEDEASSVKGGGSVSIELVRVDEQGRQLQPTHFAPTDRFKVSLSCAVVGELEASVLVFQNERGFVALAPQTLGACGNHRTLPGAFRLTGESPAEVCVVLTSPGRAVDLASVHASVVLQEPHACVKLARERSEP